MSTTEPELRKEFKKLTSEAWTVSEANDEYRAEPKLNQQQEADLEKTINDYETRLDEIGKIMRSVEGRVCHSTKKCRGGEKCIFASSSSKHGDPLHRPRPL